MQAQPGSGSPKCVTEGRGSEADQNAELFLGIDIDKAMEELEARQVFLKFSNVSSFLAQMAFFEFINVSANFCEYDAGMPLRIKLAAMLPSLHRR